MDIFAALVWIGVALTLAGLGALGWCIAIVARLRRSGLDDAAMRTGMRRAVAINMAALAGSSLGLMLVVLGLMLGD
ncbi:hypothetical protein MLD63_09115 [Paracoccus sp. TK19116]|uniref:Uncharacterized protein n=1 Tax=Paracoccus albicereus TaxID=2922394 RepID=A0ABT1MST1_9RHOB|nr:hypothetical protein [Paracoccus albicereus]MCQ0970581.1 hypothetical protein [Paracoccus albicereus]